MFPGWGLGCAYIVIDLTSSTLLLRLNCGITIFMRDNTLQLNIIEVSTTEQIAVLADLAERIWLAYYPPITGEAQTRYMLANYQSPAVISQQIIEGMRYFLVQSQEQNLGYFAFKQDQKAKSVFLSKIYLIEAARGAGIAQAILGHIEAACRAVKGDSLWLTVNRNNLRAIKFYEKQGFHNEGSWVQDIGDGFVMDDFRMRKDIY